MRISFAIFLPSSPCEYQDDQHTLVLQQRPCETQLGEMILCVNLDVNLLQHIPYSLLKLPNTNHFHTIVGSWGTSSNLGKIIKVYFNGFWGIFKPKVDLFCRVPGVGCESSRLVLIQEISPVKEKELTNSCCQTCIMRPT